MSERQPPQPVPALYTRHAAEIWAEIRTGWEAGESVSCLMARFGVRRSTVNYHRTQEQWSRQAPSRPPRHPRSVKLRRRTGIDALTIAESALGAALDALVEGRAADAMSLIKAGDAIGAFADFVAKLRGAGETAEPAPPPPALGSSGATEGAGA